MKNTKKESKVISIERRKNSIYGNPSFYLTVEDVASSEILSGKTASNAAIGYMLGYSCVGKVLTFSYHYTAKGNLIFDNAKDF